jgi:D-sedoheptulose 7-phosphate isomerase
MKYQDYLKATQECIDQVSEETIEEFIQYLQRAKDEGGRLFFIGVGGSAANCSHAVNDFRKIGNIDALTPLDNVSELTAYINDVNFEDCLAKSLETSRFDYNDTLIVFSVGGGSENTSKNIVKAIDYAKKQGSPILGIVSRDGGYTKKHADVCIHFCPSDPSMITPVAESLQVVFWHYMVNKIKTLI